MMTKQSAHTLSKYTLLDELGRGGFGVVYKAHDPALDRFVALKVLLPQFTNDPETLKRFRQEARQASRLKHPNIVTVYEVGEVDGSYFIAMEYIEGQPLNQIIQSQGKLPPSQALAIVRQMGEALDYAHQQGLLHRDVKPSNILVRPDGQALLTDFGLVKAAGEAGTTTTGLAPGTPEYMAPEQILGQEADARTDLYALGVVLYQLLVGQSPFQGNTPFAVLKGHVEQKPPDPRQLNPALGQYQAEVLLTALEKTPEQRFQSGAALAIALAEAVSKEEDQYWQGIYEQGLRYMKQGDFTAALEQWQTLEGARPGFRDVAAQISQAKQQIDLQQRYTRLASLWETIRAEAQAILELNPGQSDPQNIFTQLGLRNVYKLSQGQSTPPKAVPIQQNAPLQTTPKQFTQVQPEEKSAGKHPTLRRLWGRGLLWGGISLVAASLLLSNTLGDFSVFIFVLGGAFMIGGFWWLSAEEKKL